MCAIIKEKIIFALNDKKVGEKLLKNKVQNQKKKEGKKQCH